jgi:hypothetical protein
MDRTIDANSDAVELPARAGMIPRAATSVGYAKYLLLFFVLTLPLVNPWVRGDGVGYYAYLRAPLVQHDLHFEKDWLVANQSFVASKVDAQGYLLPENYTRTGHLGNHFSVGPALLWAPVLVPLHLLLLVLHRVGVPVAADGFSMPYRIAMGVTTSCYGFLSVMLSFRIARKIFKPQIAFLATLAIWLASSLPIYMYFNPSWSHAFSTFSVTLFLWYWERTRLQRSLRQWILLGLMAGLMGNVYYPNAILLIFPALEILYLLRAPGSDSNSNSSAPSVSSLAGQCVVFGIVFVISLLPTFITRFIVYGGPLETGYPGMSTWHWASPALWKVLFSADHGMWSWTPILFFAVIGLIFLARRDMLLGGGAILAFLAYYYFIASYPDWDGLSSFGNRFFVSLTPIFILGLAALLSALFDWIGNVPRALAVSSAAIVLFIVWNFGFIFQWGTHLVPARGEISWTDMVHNQVVVVPTRVVRSLDLYFLHRGEMMKQIETEDTQQQESQRKQGH